MLENMQYLSVRLPEDIQRRVAYGDFVKALELIDNKLAGEIPFALRKRLELEKEIIPDLIDQYPYSLDEALSIIQAAIKDFTREEFLALIDEGRFDWIYVNGEMHFIRSFFENACRVQRDIMLRLTPPKDPSIVTREHTLLNENMKIMKTEGANAYRFHVRTGIRLNESSERPGELLTVHLPVPHNATQVRNIKLLAYSHTPYMTAPADYPNRTVCFRAPLRKGDTFWVEYSYETHMHYIDAKPDGVYPIQPGFYTEEQPPHIMFTPFIRQLYAEIVGGETNPLIKAQKLFYYVTGNVNYSYVRKYSTILNIPEYAAINRKGDCGIQALLFITLCRCGGIPARWQSGLFVTPDIMDGHDWAQFYIEPYGWMYADPSFGGSARRLGNEERRAFYFGNLDPFRAPFNSEFQYEFLPPKRFTRYDPTDNQSGECEYSDRGLRGNEFERIREIISAERIPFERS